MKKNVVKKSSVDAMSIKFENVDKVYDNGIKAIDRLNLNIKPGEFCVLLGPSGCGKTTALRMIAGLESISDGYLKFNDVVVNSVAPKDRNISMVFQNYALYPFMSVYNNIAFGIKNKARNNPEYNDLKKQMKLAKNSNFEEIQEIKSELSILKEGTASDRDKLLVLKRELKAAKIIKDIDEQKNVKIEIDKLSKSLETWKNAPETKQRIALLNEKLSTLIKSSSKDTEKIEQINQKQRKLISEWKNGIPTKIENISNMLGINMFLRRKPAELSGGQRQRVALARAVSKETSIFLYDEPLSNLDAKLRAKMRIEIRELHDQLGATSIYVTHDQIEAMSMADKIIVMHKGYVQQIGTPIELIDKPFNLFVAKFIGNTDVNIFDATYVSPTTFKVGGTTIELSNKNKLKEVDWKQHKKVSLMFRPENVIVDPALVDNIKTNNFTGIINRIELLGSSVLAEVEVDKLGTVLLSIPTSFNAKVGEKFKFAINMNKIHIYDPENGYNLGEVFSEENEIAKKIWINGIGERIKNDSLLQAQKNKITLTEWPSVLIKSLFMSSEKERIQKARSKPVVKPEKIAG